MRLLHWSRVLSLGCLLVISSTASGEESPAPSVRIELVGRLEKVDRAMDAVITEFNQRQATREEAKRRLTQLMHNWLNLYLALSKGSRTEVLGKLELDFLDRVTRDRNPFVARYSAYLLGDNEAMNQGDLLLLEQLVESIELYVSPSPEATTPAAPPSRGAGGRVTPRVPGTSQ